MRLKLAPLLPLLLAALAAAPAQSQGLPAEGLRIMATGNLGNCVACHALPGQKDLQSTFGPALAGVGNRYDALQLRQWVTDARSIKPGALMPPFGTTQGTNEAVRAQPILDPGQIEHVVAALQSLR